MRRIVLSILGLGLVLSSCSNEEQAQAVNAESVTTSSRSAVDLPRYKDCNIMEVLEKQKKDNPGLAKKMENIEKHTQRIIAAKGQQVTAKGKPGGSGGGTTVTPYEGEINIKVVVHILELASAPISQSQIDSQIAVLNEDFNGTNSDLVLAPAEFAAVSGSANMNFVLHAVERKTTTQSVWYADDKAKYASEGGFDAWDSSKYLNIWVVPQLKSGTRTLLGYAQFPGGSSATDGLMIASYCFGTNGTAQSPFDLGRTATHEIGHWLNLRHIWGDGRCNQDDFVADTPTSDAPNYGCPSYPTVNCRSTDMTMNYMDYTDDPCMYMFSEGQVDRMRALFASGGARESLIQ